MSVHLRRNFVVLLSGNGLSSIFGFFTLAFNARALGPELLGVLALLQSFVVVVSSIFSFDTWQPVIKFGAEAQASKDDEKLRDIVVLGFLYDLVGAFAATAVGVAIVLFGLPFLGITSEYQYFAAIFSASIIFVSYSTAKGVLRLFGRFDLLTAIQTGISAAGLAVAVLLWHFQATFIAYVISYASLIVVQSFLIFTVVIVLWYSGDLPSLAAPRFDDQALSKAFMWFSWSTSGLSTLNVLRQHADSFVLATMLGPAATGIYKVASQIASLVSRIGDPLQQVVFPEIATLVAKSEHARLRKILVSAIILGIVSLSFVVSGAAVFGEIAIQIVGGTGYAAATIPLLWLVLSNGLAVTGFYLRPTVVTLISPEAYLYYSFIASLIFVAALYLSIDGFGIAGAGLAQVVFTIVWYFLNFSAISRRLHFKRQDFARALDDIINRLRR